MPTYEAIEEIQIGAFKPGMWRADGVIISADFDIGFTEKPTKFIINVVSPTGNYLDEESNLSYLRPWDIKFGQFRMRFYLEGFQFSRSAGVKKLPS